MGYPSKKYFEVSVTVLHIFNYCTFCHEMSFYSIKKIREEIFHFGKFCTMFCCSLQATEAADAKARERIAESRLLLGQFLINDLRLDIQSRGTCTCTFMILSNRNILLQIKSFINRKNIINVHNAIIYGHLVYIIEIWPSILTQKGSGRFVLHQINQQHNVLERCGEMYFS